jgi:hypothetical protein
MKEGRKEGRKQASNDAKSSKCSTANDTAPAVKFVQEAFRKTNNAHEESDHCAAILSTSSLPLFSSSLSLSLGKNNRSFGYGCSVRLLGAGTWLANAQIPLVRCLPSVSTTGVRIGSDNANAP